MEFKIEVGPTSMVAWERFSYAFGVAAGCRPGGVRGRWLGLVTPPVGQQFDRVAVSRALRDVPGAAYEDGWNGSFHEAAWDAQAIRVFARRPSTARRKARRIVEALGQKGTLDPVVARFRARQLVRSGD